MRPVSADPALRACMYAVLLLTCHAARATADHPGAGSVNGQYTATVNDALDTMDVHACFESPPRALRARARDAYRYLESVRIGQAVLDPSAHRGQIPLTEMGAGGCVDYRVNLRDAAAAVESPHLRRRYVDAVLVKPDQWLWLPVTGASGGLWLDFRLPEGLDASAPWPEILHAPGHVRFDMSGMSPDDSALLAIGRFDRETIRVPGAGLRAAILEGDPPVDTDKVRRWLDQGAHAVTTLYGRFPLPSPQVLIVPTGPGDEAVPWGQVLRGGGAAAHLFIDQTRPLQALQDDWVLVHELSHMIHPHLGGAGAWWSEGLATYYQNVLRARAGMISERQAWQKLHEGFERGRAQTARGETLRTATRHMRRDRLFMRVYWTGTAIALLADLELRQRGQSLDLALSRFHDCCLPAERAWMPREFMDKLDALTQSDVFMKLYGRYVDSDRFPRLAQAFEELGVDTAGDNVRLRDDAPAAALRTAIMTRPACGPEASAATGVQPCAAP